MWVGGAAFPVSPPTGVVKQAGKPWRPGRKFQNPWSFSAPKVERAAQAPWAGAGLVGGWPGWGRLTSPGWEWVCFSFTVGAGPSGEGAGEERGALTVPWSLSSTLRPPPPPPPPGLTSLGLGLLRGPRQSVPPLSSVPCEQTQSRALAADRGTRWRACPRALPAEPRTQDVPARGVCSGVSDHLEAGGWRRGGWALTAGAPEPAGVPGV